MKLKIVSWNLAYGNPAYRNQYEEKWDYLLSLGADFYLFQEARPSEKSKGDEKHLVWNEIGGKRNWGSGVYSQKYDLIPEEIIDSNFNGAFTIANTEIGSTKLTLISLYGLMDEGYSIPNLHRMLSDLTPVFYGKNSGRRNIVLGGDFNASLQFDLKQRNNSHKIFFERLEDFNLINCNKFNKYLQTLRRNDSEIPWQNDYFFISKQLEGNLTDCDVAVDENVNKLSDHSPVLITLDL